MNLKQIVLDFFEREGIAEGNIGIAVSGGVDSIVLLDLVGKDRKPENIFVLHVNHGTRSACESEQQEVEQLCKTKGYKFLCTKLVNKPDKNLEANWRNERRSFFENVKKEHNLKRVLTAHHATDLVETMIWRLTKGCGVSGLAPFDVSTKPLWEVPKSEIIKYATTNNLRWSEDESNLNTNFERNKIRHEVIPNLRTITPNLEQVYVREAKHFSGIANMIENQLPKLEPVELKKFLEWSPTIQSEFLRRISKKTPSSDELADCMRWLGENPRGNTRKQLGGTEVIFKGHTLSWK